MRRSSAASAALLLLLFAASSGTAWALQPGAVPDARGHLWIIHATHLESVAEEWREYRQRDGWQVTLYPVDPSLSSAECREELAALLRTAFRLHRTSDRGQQRFAALLLGDVGERGIPTWSCTQDDPSLKSGKAKDYITDHPYQVGEGDDELPRIALGRVPARTVAEARIVLEKIRRYEAARGEGDWRNRVIYAAGEARFGPFDPLFEWLFRQMVGRIIPDTCELSMTWANPSSVYCPPPTLLSDTLVERLGAGALLFNYVGHGSARSLDALRWRGKRFPSLRVRDLERLEGDGRSLPVALLSCCSTGWFDLKDGKRSLAEAMLLHPRGPIGVIAGSRVTHPYASVLLQKDLSRLLLTERVETLGELDLRAMCEMLVVDEMDADLDAIAATIGTATGWQSSLEELRVMHVRMYNLFGDPALRLALPPETDVQLELRGPRLQGDIDGMLSGTATLSIETDRDATVHADEIIPVDGADDPELERKAAHNYALANQRVLREVRVLISKGQFSIRLDRLPASASLIRVSAVGRDGKGRQMEALGAIRLLGH